MTRRRLVATGALIAVAAALACVVVPAWLIQPFRPQTAREVALAYALRHHAPVVTAVVALAAAAAIVWLWRESRRLARVGLVLLAVFAGAAAWGARQNQFEWMFRPLPSPAWARADAARFLGAEDRVLAVHVRGDAAAYPVRALAYHHLVHDVVGGVPIVVTY